MKKIFSFSENSVSIITANPAPFIFKMIGPHILISSVSLFTEAISLKSVNSVMKLSDSFIMQLCSVPKCAIASDTFPWFILKEQFV